MLVASVALGLLWELVAKRQFQQEIFSIAQVADDIHDARLRSVTTDFSSGVDFPTLLDTAAEIDILFAYARTWRHNYDKQLRALAKRKDVKLRIILPDPDNEDILSELGRRFGVTKEEMRSRILETTEEFAAMFSRDDGTKQCYVYGI